MADKSLKYSEIQALEKLFDEDATKGRKVVAHLYVSNRSFEKLLAGKVLELAANLAKLQVSREKLPAQASKINNLSMKFVGLLSKIGKNAKNKPSYKWTIPKTSVPAILFVNKNANKLLLKLNKPKRFSTIKSQGSFSRRRRK